MPNLNRLALFFALAISLGAFGFTKRVDAGWIPIIDDLGVLFGDVADKVSGIPGDLKTLGDDIGGVLGPDIRREWRSLYDALERAAIPGVNGYLYHLEVEASRKRQGLDPKLIQILQKHYKVDLGRIRIAPNIDTLHGSNITVGHTIYFTTSLNFSDKSNLDRYIADARAVAGTDRPPAHYNQLWVLLHELEHAVQYESHNGITPFLVKYLINGGIESASNGSFDIHDAINLEREATRKANSLFASVAAQYLKGDGNTNDYGSIFGLHRNGKLYFYGLTGVGSSDPKWHIAGKEVGASWGFKHVTALSANSVLAVKEDGRVFYYKYDYVDGKGTPKWTVAGKKIADGWKYKQVIGGADGEVFAVTSNGDMHYYKMQGLEAGRPSFKVSGKKIGAGWGFKHLVPGDGGLIYAIKPDGTMHLYKFCGFNAKGYPIWFTQEDFGWGWIFDDVVAVGNNSLCAMKSGRLYYYHHAPDAKGKQKWVIAGKLIGDDWAFGEIFARREE